MTTTAIDEIYKRLNDDTEPEEIDWSESKIPRFFAGKTVLLSGATGYMGKVFVEKILRECPEVKCIYVLVRQKKGVMPHDIMKKYFKNVIFEKLRRISPNFEEKICTITGDLQQDRLALSEEDRKTLIETVDIIVHNGATTRFDERISVSLKINVLGTKNLLDLAMECKRIQVFVHVSTAYSHCYRKDIEEKFYDSPADLKAVHNIIASDESLEHGLSEEALNKFLGHYPNVYCFSKATAEGLVKQYGDKANFAMGVYRPSVVVSAMSEPLAGWSGNNNGPTLLLVGSALGVIHCIYYLDYAVDLIPVDYTINALIGVIYDIGPQWQAVKKPMMYNYGSSTLNPATLNYLENAFKIEAPNIGSMNVVWHQFTFLCKSKWLFWFWHILLHFIPAIFADLAFLCMGKKPRALQLFFFATKHLDKIDYYANGNWKIHAAKTMEAHDRLSKADQTKFCFDIRTLDWAHWAINSTRGSRLYILKEPFDNMKKTKTHYQRIKKLHYTTTTFFALLIAYYVIKLISCLL